MVTLTKPTVGDVAFATALNQNWTDTESALNGIDPVPALYGDGSDSSLDVTSGTTTLTEDKYYTTLIVRSGAVLATAGYRVYARTSVTVEAGGTIRNNGSNGAAGVGGAGGPSGTLGGGGSGGAAFGGTSTFGSFGGNGGDSTQSGGDAFAPGNGSGKLSIGVHAYSGLRMSAGNHGQTQGGAGGGGGTSSAGGGGGGGVVLIVTPTLVLGGTIEARGGNGNGNAGGGGGGVVILLYGSKTGAGTISAAAGTGGTGTTAGTAVEITV